MKRTGNSGDHSLYWYDLETFGIDPKETRIAQFAGVRTDQDLNIIDDPQIYYCRLSDDILPDPQSCLLTGITPQKVNRLGLAETEFIDKVNQRFSKPKTCVVGYNNIRFDDEFVRYCLYRNFLDPYAREWQNGNSRWDIIDMVRLTWALRPEGINWPKHEDGQASFKLEHLTHANGLDHETAHDAMSDVLATIAVAKLIKQNQSRLYQFVYNNRSKQALSKLLSPSRPVPVLHVSSMYSTQQACTALVLPLAVHPTNKNGIIVYDLNIDPRPLLEFTAQQLRDNLFTPTEKLDNPRVPLKVVHLNKSPIIVPQSVLDSDSIGRTGIDLHRCRQHLDTILSANPAAKIQEVYKEFSFEASTDPDHGLYNGFFNPADKVKMQAIRKQSASQLAQSQWHFEDRRLAELLFRYRARNFFHSLSEDEKQQWQEFRYTKLMIPGQSAVSLKDYQTAIEQLRNENPDKKLLLDELQDWGSQIEPRVEPA